MNAYIHGALSDNGFVVIISDFQRCSIAIGVAALATLLTIFFGNPLFATNDDAALAMAGAGFGMASKPEAHLLVSHYGYGLLLNGLSQVIGVRTHGIVSLCGVGFSLGLFAYAMGRRLDTIIAALFAAGGLIYSTALLTPQFTVTAGVLVAAAVACLMGAIQRREVSSRLLACVYPAIVLGLLIRPASAIIVFIVCTPALSWVALRSSSYERRQILEFATAMIAIAVLAFVTDWMAYRFSSDWQNSIQYNITRSLFNDLNRVKWSNNAQAYKDAGWSANDFRIFNAWFTNHEIFNLKNITTIASDRVLVGTLVDFKVIAAWFSSIITAPQLFCIIIVQGLLLVAFREAWPINLLLLIGIICAILVSASTGRPPLDRVMLTITAGGLLCGFASIAKDESVQKITSLRMVVSVGIALVGLGVGQKIIREQIERVKEAVIYRENMLAASPHLSGRVVSWAASITWEWLVTPTYVSPLVLNKTIPTISALSPTPIMTSALGALGIQDLSKTLCLDSDIRLVAPDRYVFILEKFCEEHYRVRPNYILIYKVSPRTFIFERQQVSRFSY